MTLRNFRGVQESTVDFAPGVTVVQGPNEIGKSSLMEALGLIRHTKANSKAREVVAVQPIGRDVGPEVELTLTTGAYDLTYTKRWLRKPKTELTIRAPQPRQLSGDEAHEKFSEILAKTVDSELLDALTVVQGESLQRPSLASVQALHRALDNSGQAVEGHDELLTRIDEEYARYFTLKTGKPTGDYKDLGVEVAALVGQMHDIQRRSAEMDRLTDDHARAVRHLAAASEQLAAARVALRDHAERNAQIDTLRQAANDAHRRYDDAERARAAAHQAVETRSAQARDVADRDRRLGELRSAASSLADELAAAQTELDHAKEAAAQAESTWAAARDAAASAARELAQRRLRIEYDERRARLDRALAAEKVCADARADSDRIQIDDAVVQHLAELETAATVARRVREGAAGRIRVTPLGDVPVIVDGGPIPPGATREIALLAPISVQVDQVVTVDALPGRSHADLDAEQRRTAEELTSALATAGVESVVAARKAAAMRRDAVARLEHAEATLTGLLDGESLESLRARVAQLASDLGVADPGEATAVASFTRADAAQADAAQADAARADAARADAARADAAQADAAQAERDEQVAHEERDRALERLNVARHAHEDAHARSIRAAAEVEAEARERDRLAKLLDEARRAASDEQLAAELAYAETTLERSEADRAQAAADLAAVDPETVSMQLRNAEELIESKAAEVEQARTATTELRTRLDERAADGIYDELADTRSRYELLAARYRRQDRSARAVSLLREVMLRHRDEAQRRYVAPFKAEIERLGRVVFGPSFQVEISDDLAMESRTVDGVTVPFTSLSAGAREQLSLIGRLACAALIDPIEGAPVILDDTLGFADPHRLEQLNVVIGEVGRTAQVVVLTCQPERFAAIGGAVVVPLPLA